jgi:hypothetical protein
MFAYWERRKSGVEEGKNLDYFNTQISNADTPSERAKAKRALKRYLRKEHGY